MPRLLFRSFALLLCAALLGSCQPSRRLTKANVAEVNDGMARKQVESILGLPTSVETKDPGSARKTTYLYVQANGSVIITFKEDKVESKESTLTE